MRKRGKWYVVGGMRTLLVFLICLPLTTYHVPRASAASRVEIRHGQFYVDGQPFYVVGVGYNGLRPHQRPGVSYADTNRHWTEHDFERIKAAHFNTIRTWDALDPEELALAQKYGLMVLQGIWLDQKQDFSDPHNQDSAVSIVKDIAMKSRPYDNVLGYVVMTEPSLEAVTETGAEGTLQFFRKLKRAIQQIDPRPVTMDSWLPIAFLDHSLWDFTMFNAYAFTPKSINYALGFAGYTHWLVNRFRDTKPFIVGETGGYAVSKSSFSALFGGYGGLDEYTQSLKDLDSLRGTIEGHADGFILVSWIDTWYYPKDPDTHDDEPWEWDGLLGIATDRKKDMEGIPRQVYQDVSHFNEEIIIEPKPNHFYDKTQSIPIQVYAADNVAHAEYNLNEGDWKPLEGSGPGLWQGFFTLPKTARHRQRMGIRVLDSNGTELTRREISFLTAVPEEHLTIERVESSTPHAPLQFAVHITENGKEPPVGRKVFYGFFFPAGWREAQGTVTTDPHGQAIVTCPIMPTAQGSMFYIAAGTESPDNVRTGDMKLFDVSSQP